MLLLKYYNLFVKKFTIHISINEESHTWKIITLTFKIESINKTTNFGKPYLKEYWYVYQTMKWVTCATKLPIIFQILAWVLLQEGRNCILNEHRSIDLVLQHFHHLSLFARMSSQRNLGSFLSLLVNGVVSYDIFSYNCEGFPLPMRALLEEKRLNAIALLNHGCSTREVSKLLGMSQCTCFRICKECVPHVGPSRRGHPRTITLAQRRVCMRAIKIGGLNNVVGVRDVSSEHLNVVASTKTMRCVLHEVDIRSLQK